MAASQPVILSLSEVPGVPVITASDVDPFAGHTMGGETAEPMELHIFDPVYRIDALHWVMA